MKLKMFLILLLFCNIFYCADVEWVKTGEHINMTCVSFCLSPAVDDSNYPRGIDDICLWAHATLREEDVNKLWRQEIVDSSGKVIKKNLLKIMYDKTEYCLNKDEPPEFPNGYALYYLDDNNKWQYVPYPCLNKNIASDGKYDLVSVMEPQGCYSSVNCKYHLGHYTYKLYEEDIEKGSATFWIVPNFAKYNIDEFHFHSNSQNEPAIFHDGRECGNCGAIDVNTNPTTNIRAFMTCSDWEKADISIEDYYYYPSGSGHHFHVEAPIHYSFSSSPSNEYQNWFGRFYPQQAKMALNKNGNSEYNFTWEIGNVSGKYLFVGKISKEFDGRIFTDISSFESYVLVPGLKRLSTSVPWIYKPYTSSDVHIDGSNWYVKEGVETLMSNAINDFNCWLWSEYNQRNGSYLRLTDASLVWGGLFDRGGSGENWTGLHSRHRLGYNADFSSTLTDGLGLTDRQQRKLNSIVMDKAGNNSFCIVESDGHHHCRFYNGQ